MSDTRTPSVVTGPVTVVLNESQVRSLLEHLDFSVRQGGIRHAVTALPLAHLIETAAVNAAKEQQPQEDHAG